MWSSLTNIKYSGKYINWEITKVTIDLYKGVNENSQESSQKS